MSQQFRPRLDFNETKQLLWLAYWRLKRENDGIPPTRYELMAAIGYKHVGSVTTAINQMVAEGWFTISKTHQSRNLRAARPETDEYAPLSEKGLMVLEDLQHEPD